MREVENEIELRNACLFCVQSFFGRNGNILKKISTNSVAMKLFNAIVSKFRGYDEEDGSFFVALDNNLRSSNSISKFPLNVFNFLLKKNEMKYKNNIVGYVQLSNAQISSTEYNEFFMKGQIPHEVKLSNDDAFIYLPKISNLVVAEQYRGCGVGKRLVNMSIAKAKDWGFNQVILEVQEDNTAALNFYISMGFDRLYKDAQGERFEFNGLYFNRLREPKIVMRKLIF